MSMPPAEVAVESRPRERKPYRTPQLTVFGPLSKLTQNGSGSTSENNGKGVCGVIYNTKGGKNC